MGILSRFARTKYDDDQIVYRIQVAINEDPLVPDTGALSVVSDHGLVTIAGVVHKEPEKDHIEGVARTTLRDSGLKFDRIVNEIEVRQAVTAE